MNKFKSFSRRFQFLLDIDVINIGGMNTKKTYEPNKEDKKPRLVIELMDDAILGETGSLLPMWISRPIKSQGEPVTW